MKNKNVIIFGANGMLGYAVQSFFSSAGFPVFPLTRKEVDIARVKHIEVKEIIHKLLNEGEAIVINCAGIIKPQIQYFSPEEVLLVNGIFPHNLAKICKELAVNCYHITTDCVFDGRRGRYSENDLADAEDLYGLSKACGDSAECMVLRTSIIGEEKETKRSLLEWVRGNAGKKVNGYTNHYWNGITTLQLAKVIMEIEQKALYSVGINHIFSPQAVTKYELLQFINEVYGLGITVEPFEADNFCDRTLASNRGLIERLGIPVLEEQLREMRNFFR